MVRAVLAPGAAPASEPRCRRARRRHLPRHGSAAARPGVASMIARLRGTVARTAAGLVLDVGGVGYLVAATPRVGHAWARDDRRDLPARPRGRAPALRLRRGRRAGAVRAAARRHRRGPRWRSRSCRGRRGRAAARDRARGHRALRGHPGDRPKTAQRIVLELKEKLGRRPSRSCGPPGAPAADLVAREALVELAGRSSTPSARSQASTGTCRSRSRCGGAAAGGMREAARFLAPTAQEPDEEELDRSLRPAVARRLRRSGAGQGAARDRARRREGARRGARPRPARRAARARQDLARADRARRARRRHPQVAGPALERKGDIAAILTALEPRDVLFVDEIHRSTAPIEEILYPALEDFRLDIIVGQGPAARTLTLDLPPFTLVGATTRTGLLTTPLRDRFGLTFRLDLYEPPSSSASCAARRASSASRSRTTPRRRSPAARAARRASRTASCGACATSPRCATRARSPRRSRARRSSCSTSTSAGSSASTVSCSRGRRPVRRRPRRPLDARGRAGRGGRHDRGRLRAVPAPARLPAAHAARPDRDRARSATTSARSPRRRPLF